MKTYFYLFSIILFTLISCSKERVHVYDPKLFKEKDNLILYFNNEPYTGTLLHTGSHFDDIVDIKQVFKDGLLIKEISYVYNVNMLEKEIIKTEDGKTCRIFNTLRIVEIEYGEDFKTKVHKATTFTDIFTLNPWIESIYTESSKFNDKTSKFQRIEGHAIWFNKKGEQTGERTHVYNN